MGPLHPTIIKRTRILKENPSLLLVVEYHQAGQFLFGVGGRGRRPIESADPQVRRVGRPFETLLSVTEQNGSLESSSGGQGAGVTRLTNGPKSLPDFGVALS